MKLIATLKWPCTSELELVINRHSVTSASRLLYPRKLTLIRGSCMSADGSREKLVAAFLANLDYSWHQHGREILSRMWAERPEVYFKAMVKLALVLHPPLGPNDFDRRRSREEALQRLEGHKQALVVRGAADPRSSSNG